MSHHEKMMLVRRQNPSINPISAIANAFGSTTTIKNTKTAVPVTTAAPTLAAAPVSTILPDPTTTAPLLTSASPTTTAVASPAAAAAPASTSHLPVIIGAAVGGFIVVALIFGFFIRRSAKSAKLKRESMFPDHNRNPAMPGPGQHGFKKSNKRGDGGDEEFHSKNADENYNDDYARGSYQDNGEKDQYHGDIAGETGYGNKYASKYLSGGLAGLGGAVGKNSKGGRSPSPNEGPHSPYSVPSPSFSTTSYPPGSASSNHFLLQDPATSGYDCSPSSQSQHQPKGSTNNEGNAPIIPVTTSPFADNNDEGKVYIVKRTFEPSLGDELVIYPGDRVQLLISYDDGWALGVNLDAQEGSISKGVFPFDCLEESPVTSSPSSHSINRIPSPSYANNDFPTSVSASSIAPKSNSNLTTSNHYYGRSNEPTSTNPTIHVSDFANDESYRREHEERAKLRNVYDEEDDYARKANRVDGQKKKRISSMIASRDAELYLALGDQSQENHDGNGRNQYQNRPLQQQSSARDQYQREDQRDRRQEQEITYSQPQSSYGQQNQYRQNQNQNQYR